MNTFGTVIVFLVIVALIAKVSLGATGVNKAAALEKIKQGATVVDVRTPAEYESGHYKGAKNIPLQELQDRLAELGDKKTVIVGYCASGARSAQAAKILTAAGFSRVGMPACAGIPLVKPDMQISRIRLSIGSCVSRGVFTG